MKAPDKIYLHGYSFDDEPCKSWEREPKVKGMRGYPAQHAEYICKDTLLEWAKEMKEYRENQNDSYYDSAITVLEMLIDELNSM